MTEAIASIYKITCHKCDVTLSEIDVSSAIKRAKEMAASDKELPSSVRSVIEVLVLIVELLLNRLNITSRNSSTPPSQDPHRERGRRVRAERKRKIGGQPGHKGETIARVENPDKIQAAFSRPAQASPRPRL